ncbi:MAG: succinate dehydrogenase cytochrome b subunit [Bacteroidales bacterium]|nr:succinate dehydrogenase cytochrome b subunit [Bacteroidales bacterium]
MKGFLSSSIGKKLLMSLSGLFLIVFLLVHLTVNITMLFDPIEGKVYNTAANFMGTNPIMKVMEPILAFGFFIHILYGFIVQFNNWKARGNNKYAVVNQKDSSTWASRNMIWLGIFVFAFLVVHIINYYAILKFGEPPSTHVGGVEMHDTFKLVSDLFAIWWYDVIYIIGFIALGLHLHHALWSAFQTIGLNNKLWRRRLEVIGDIYTVIVVIGFTIIPLYFLIF